MLVFHILWLAQTTKLKKDNKKVVTNVTTFFIYHIYYKKLKPVINTIFFIPP